VAGQVQGRRALVTGASSGIGRAIAEAFAAEGAAVAAVARRGDRLADLHAACGALPVVADLSVDGQARRAVEEAAGALGGLDVLVNNAGVALPALVADADPADWRAMLDLNVLALLAVTQAALPHLRAAGAGAAIVNMSSMSGRRVPSPTLSVYAATKHAVHAIGEGLRQELEGSGVRVTTVAPGFVDTEIFDARAAEEGGLARQYQETARRVGMAPQDVAAAVLHAVAAPPSVGTVEIALLPTSQHDSRYRTSVER
jgi:NADP-dependent 3-hydroxy acid dehydrogenase YdfG